MQVAAVATRFVANGCTGQRHRCMLPVTCLAQLPAHRFASLAPLQAPSSAAHPRWRCGCRALERLAPLWIVF